MQPYSPTSGPETLEQRAKRTRMTPLDLAYAEWDRMTSKPDSPFYGMDPQTFARNVEESTGDKRYQLLNQGKAVRGLQLMGNFFDSEFVNTGVAGQGGRAARALGDWFTDDAGTLDAMAQMGEELPGQIAALGPLAAATVVSGGTPLYAAMGLTALDAFTDNREAGRTVGSSAGGAALAGLSVGVMPATGRFFESIGAATAARMAGAAPTRFATSLATGALNTATRTVVREAGQIGVGVGFDIADVAAFDPNRTLADLTKQEYLLPMLLSNGVTVLGQEAITHGTTALRNRITKPGPDYVGMARERAESERTALQQKKAELDQWQTGVINFEQTLESRRDANLQAMYDQTYWDHYLSDSDISTAAAHRVASQVDMFDYESSRFGQEVPADFLTKMVGVGLKKNMPVGTLMSRVKGLFNNIREGADSDADAYTRVVKLLEDEKKLTYADIPVDLRNNPSAGKVYNIFKERIRKGQAELIYTDEGEGITAVALNPQLGAATQLAVFKGGARLTGSDLDAALVSHGDGIRAGVGDYVATVDNLRTSLTLDGGFRVGAGVDEGMANTVKETLKGLGITTPVYLVGDDLSAPELARFRGHFNEMGKYGTMLELDNGSGPVALVWTKGGQGRAGVSAMMHEVGHVVERFYARKFPEALQVLKQQAGDAFGNMDLSTVEGLRRFGPAHPEFLMKVKQGRGKMKYDFPEYFANQFSKWAVDTMSKPKTVVDRYIKTVVDALRGFWEKFKQQFHLPDKSFKPWMENMARRFYTNLMWNDDTVFRELSGTYLLGDSGTDALGRAFYENSDPRFHELMSHRLAKWHALGRRMNPETIIALAQADWEQNKGVNLSAVQVPVRKEMVDIMFGGEAIGVPAQVIDATLAKFTKMYDEGSFIDPYESGGVVRTLVQRWAAGELPNQKGVPKAGGAARLNRRIESALGKLAQQSEVQTLKVSGAIDNGNEKIHYFDDIVEAREAMKDYAVQAAWEMYQIEPQRVKRGNKEQYKLVFKFAPDARKVSFDEQYHNAEMDSAVGETVDQARQWSVDELALKLPDNVPVITAAMRPHLQKFAMEVPMEAALDMGSVGVYNPTEFSQRMGTAIVKSLGEKTAPESLLRALDEVVKLSTNDPSFQADVKSIGREIGYTGESFDGFVGALVQKLTTGKSVKELSLLAPDAIGRVMREVGALVDQYGKITEYGARVGSLLGIHEKSLEQLKNTRARATELLTVDKATQQLAGILSDSTEGGMAARLDRFQHKPSMIRRAYEATINGFTHMAAANPMLRPFDEATSMEKRDQHRMINDTMVPLHAKDVNTLKPEFEKDRAYAVVKNDPKLNDLFNQMVLLEQFENKSIAQLNQEKNPELQAIISAVPADKLPKFMELRERMYKVQEQNVQLRAAETRQLDRLNLATFLVRQVPDMPPKQAQTFIDTLYNSDPSQLPAILKQTGMDDATAARVLQFKTALDDSTTQMIQRLQAAPWYVSEQRMGKFLVRFFDKESNSTGATSFDTREQAQAWIDQSKATISARRIEDMSLKYGNRMTGDFRDTLDSTIKAKQAQIQAMFGDDQQLMESMQGVLDDVFQSVDSAAVAATKGTLSITRKHAAGRETLDMLDQQRESVRRATVGLTRARTDALYNLYSLDPFFQTPDGARQLGLAKQHRKNFREPDTEAGMAASKFSFAMTIGTNVSSMVQEVASLPLVLAPMAREMGAGFTESFSLPKKIVTEMGKKYLGSGKFANEDWNAVIERATRENTLTARHLVDIDEQHILNDVGTRRIIEGGKTMKAVGSLAEMVYNIGTKLYQPAATISGTTSILTGFELSKKYNPTRTFDEHYAAALQFHSLAQGAHGKAGRPVGMFSTSGPMRTLSQVAYTLQSFANAQIGNFVRWGQKGWIDDGQFTPAERASARSAFKQAMAITIGTVGLTGIPLVGAVSKLAEKAFGVNPEHELESFMFKYLPGDEAEKAFMVNMALRGSTYSMGLPFDLQSRMTVGGLFALNNFDGFNAGNLFGVPGNFLQQSAEALGGFVRGQGPAAAVDMAPAGLKRALQLWLDEGKFVKNGEVLLEPNAMEKAFAYMGFTPTRLKQGYDLHAAKEYFMKKETSARASASDRIVDLLSEGRADEAQALLLKSASETQGLRTPEESVKLLQNEVARRYANLHTPTAHDPGRTSNAPMLNAVYGGGQQTSATQRYFMELQAKGMMGAPVAPSRSRLQLTGLTDQLQRADPSLSPVLAGTYARLQMAGVYETPLSGPVGSGAGLQSLSELP